MILDFLLLVSIHKDHGFCTSCLCYHIRCEIGLTFQWKSILGNCNAVKRIFQRELKA